MPRLVEVCVGGDLAPWTSLGLRFSGSSCDVAGVRLTVQGGVSGLVHWTIALDGHSSGGPSTRGPLGMVPERVEIDTIATDIVQWSSAHQDGPTPIGDQRVVGVDHVVVATDDADRTCAALAASLGLEVRRTRDAGNGVEQRFFKLDNAIIEVVSGPHTRGGGASLWGLVVSVDDLFDLAEALGPDVLSPPKRAVQPGRFIATVRGSVGLGVPFALMTPHYSSSSSSPAN